MHSILEFRDYRDFIVSVISDNKDVYGYKAKIAAAAGCQRSYFSQVLSGKAHLSPEQALKLSGFWQFTALESQYFIHLVAKNRAGTKELAEFYESELSKLRDASTVLSKRYEQADIATDDQSIYYSNWLFAAVHMLVTVPKFQTVNALVERLQIAKAAVNHVLNELEKMGLVTCRGNYYLPKRKALHVSKDSNFNTLNHQNWRQRAVADSIVPTAQGLHYTAIYSLSNADVARLKKLLLEFMDKTRALVAPSPEEEVICFNCDLFRV